MFHPPTLKKLYFPKPWAKISVPAAEAANPIFARSLEQQ